VKINKTKAKDGTPRYQVKIYVSGETSSKTFRDLGAAKTWGAAEEHFLMSGGVSVRRQGRSMTFAGLAAKYLADESRRLKPNTQRLFASRFARWAGYIGETPLGQITPERIKECVRVLEGEVSPDTVNTYLDTLSLLFRYAEQVLCSIERNPCDFVGHQKRSKKVLPLHRWLSLGEIGTLLHVCQQSFCSDLYPIVAVMLSTFAKMEEVRALTWADIDFERARIRYLGRYGMREVLLCWDAMEVMRRQYDGRRAGAVYCFQSPTENKAIDFRHTWSKAIAQAGLAGLQPSDLQATSVDSLYRKGASLESLAQIIGVKSQDTVIRLLSPAGKATSRVDGLNEPLSLIGSAEKTIEMGFPLV